jgi:hypothetical protein
LSLKVTLVLAPAGAVLALAADAGVAASSPG